jgi:L-asparaginase II
MNCSGKHAAMLATCVRNGWPTETYRDPAHPVQQAIRAALEDSAGEPATAVAVDGCGAPLLAISLAGLARAFGRFAAAAPESPEGRIVGAFRRHPEYASGSRRGEAALIRSVPGLFAKGGAEAVYAVGLADGRGIAVKIDDGASRARAVVVAATLRRLGVDNDVIRGQLEYPLLGGGQPVGSVRPAAELTTLLATERGRPTT